MRNTKTFATSFAAVAMTAALAACGGGGGGNPLPTTGGGSTLTPTPTATPCPSGWTGSPPNCAAPTTTVAQGTLVDDPSGTPLAGVTVRVDPWATYATPGPTPTPIATTTTDANGHFVVNEPNGTYLLVIGDDAVHTPPPGWATPAPNATDTPIPGASTWRPTIHDRIVLTGGGTVSSPMTLKAPTLIPQPLYTPPAVETNGDYRLTTIDALNEAPCYLYWNQQREANGLLDTVLDEWSTENSRAIAWVGFQPNGAGQYVQFLTVANGIVSGGANCVQFLSPAWRSTSGVYPFATNAQALWFGGSYIPYNAQHSGAGGAEFPVDPRIQPDPSGTPWP